MLPDYLAPNLDIVFVGLNPGIYSDQVGHYFARKQNLFWTALSESGIAAQPLGPRDDARIVELGLGLTDLVKRATHGAGEIKRMEFQKGGQELRAKIAPLEPSVVCFVGLTGYRAAFDARARLGAQASRWGTARLFVVPSTSARNARYRNEIVEWFKRLKIFLKEIKNEHVSWRANGVSVATRAPHKCKCLLTHLKDTGTPEGVRQVSPRHNKCAAQRHSERNHHD